MTMLTTEAHGAGTVPEWTLADRLAKARKSAELTQIQLSGVTGLARSTIIKYEAGQRPTRAHLLVWALATGVPYGWLATGEVDLRSPEGGGDLRDQYSPCISDLSAARTRRRADRAIHAPAESPPYRKAS
jgi:transcriptional regulator with XRE-family HTH domain